MKEALRAWNICLEYMIVPWTERFCSRDFALFKINSLKFDKYILTLDNIHDIIPVNERRW